MKNGKLSIGLIGAGRAGMIHARNLRASVPHAALTAVADPVEAAARAACEELELEPKKARAFIGNDAELLRNTLYQDQYIYMAV